MPKITTMQSVQCKAFIISPVDCVRLPDHLDQKFRIMANLLIDRYLASKVKQGENQQQAVVK